VQSLAEQVHTSVAIQHLLGTLLLDVQFSTSAPWTILFGPSGSGKSTILRAIAGLLRPDSGSIELLGKPVYDFTAGVDLPAHRRPVRWAGQRTALFPHETVRRNILRGISGLSGHAANEVLEQALRHFDLESLATRLPPQLSGGQQQRVAVARTAAGARGKVLLLDEPFSGLDAGVRDQLVLQLRGWMVDAPILSVTHDVGEAFLLNAHIVRIAAGRVMGQGSVGALLAEERRRLLQVL
jgi:molybdate transport system ATP-binding protein